MRPIPGRRWRTTARRLLRLSPCGQADELSPALRNSGGSIAVTRVISVGEPRNRTTSPSGAVGVRSHPDPRDERHLIIVNEREKKYRPLW